MAERQGGAAPPQPPRSSRGPVSPYTVFLGLAFIALVALAGINALRTREGGTLGVGVSGKGEPLAEFAVADARGELSGDANVAQDDCNSSARPCPASDRRTPACRVDEAGAIRVCDLFDKPLVLSFWFTRGGDCEAEQDVFEAAYRRYRSRVNFLAIDVRDPRNTVTKLIDERGWTHQIGLDTDGALSNLYRIGGCPSFIYVYPGGIVQDTSIGELSTSELGAKIDMLQKASAERAAANR
ncbi:MAG: TlpA family protein disulfide reductase [Solirubrobacterales bacterium]